MNDTFNVTDESSSVENTFNPDSSESFSSNDTNSFVPNDVVVAQNHEFIEQPLQAVQADVQAQPQVAQPTPAALAMAALAAAAAKNEPVAVELPEGFIKLGLADELVRAVADMGFTTPTSVQLKTIPLAMGGATGTESAKFIDLLVSSQTGSGKTAAFLLPVLHTLLMQQEQAKNAEREEFERATAEAAARGEAPPKRAKRKDPTSSRNFKAATPGALILCPTRELAQQVANDAVDLVRHCRGLRIASVVGGIPYQIQIAKLQNADLVVATPGRLLDLQRSMQIKLDQVQFLVVDEADRMLDLGFADDLAEVNQLTIERKQTMMFSATFAPRIQQLAGRVMRQPQRVEIDSQTEKHANIKQSLYWADNAQHKRKMLDHWLRDTTIDQAIVFASTQIECDGLAGDLQQAGFSAVALHGALSQGLRNRRLMALRNGQVQILVATDVAARGIDVPTITHVFNFGLPMKAEDYTHRIGRTGRAGRDGLAVTFAEFRDRRKIFDIEAYSKQPFKSEVIVGLEPQQRFPDSRPRGDSNRESRDNHSRDRKFGGGGGRGGNTGNAGFGGNSGYARKPAFGDRGNFGAPRNEGGYAPRNEGFAPRGGNEGGYAPRNNEGFAPRGGNEGFAPRGGNEGGYAPRNEGFAAPRNEGFKPAFNKPSFSKPGFGKGGAGKSVPGAKPFASRDGVKRAPRPAR